MEVIRRRRIPKELHWKGNNLLCLDCKKFLSTDSFSVDKKSLHRDCHDLRCRDCKSKRNKLNKSLYKYSTVVDSILRQRIHGAKQRATKFGWEFNLTLKILQDKLLKQSNLCALSGIELTFIRGKGRTHTNVSIDRIDSSKGYTIENTQLVCMAVNQMKSDLSLEEFLSYCNKIINRNR